MFGVSNVEIGLMVSFIYFFIKVYSFQLDFTLFFPACSRLPKVTFPELDMFEHIFGHTLNKRNSHNLTHIFVISGNHEFGELNKLKTWFFFFVTQNKDLLRKEFYAAPIRSEVCFKTILCLWYGLWLCLGLYSINLKKYLSSLVVLQKTAQNRNTCWFYAYHRPRVIC